MNKNEFGLIFLLLTYTNTHTSHLALLLKIHLSLSMSFPSRKSHERNPFPSFFQHFLPFLLGFSFRLIDTKKSRYLNKGSINNNSKKTKRKISIPKSHAREIRMARDFFKQYHLCE